MPLIQAFTKSAVGTDRIDGNTENDRIGLLKYFHAVPQHFHLAGSTRREIHRIESEEHILLIPERREFNGLVLLVLYLEIGSFHPFFYFRIVAPEGCGKKTGKDRHGADLTAPGEKVQYSPESCQIEPSAVS